MICFYHSSDLDGQCSGAIVKLCSINCVLYPINYHEVEEIGGAAGVKAIIEQSTNLGERVYICDFSFDRPIMEYLISNYKVYWFDHHISSINDCKGLSIAGVQDKTHAGCGHTWKGLMDMPMPQVVDYIDAWDNWTWENRPDKDNIRYLHEGLGTINTDPTTKEGMDNWYRIIFNNDQEMVKELLIGGKAICSYLKNYNATRSKMGAFVNIFEDKRWITINSPGTGSQIFDSIYEPAFHDGMMRFALNRDLTWGIRLYSTKSYVNCAEIAKKWKGGGHFSAAAFVITHDDLTLVINKTTKRGI